MSEEQKVIEVYNNDCIDQLKKLEENSIDSIVTDPPYGLGFMGKEWDALPPGLDFAKEALRVLKPGGYMVAFGGSRTYHRLAVSLEDAGFEIRDQLMWVYGSGFPKSHNISKAIDKESGVEREVVGLKKLGGNAAQSTKEKGGTYSSTTNSVGVENIYIDITAPATDDAAKWDGWGTALKPAHEPICLAQKPISEKTIAKNILKWGTGGLNIDDSRIGTDDTRSKAGMTALGQNSGWNSHNNKEMITGSENGRWPANIIFDEEAGEILDETGYSKNPSKFFYCPKASKKEREFGLGEYEEKQQDLSRKEGNPGRDNPRNRGLKKRKNHHPTVKPIDLMKYLCTLITPPGGTILDPFLGSGTTGIAAKELGFDFIGIEKDKEYFEIAKKRIEAVTRKTEGDNK